MRDGDWMQTFTGLQFWPTDPRVEEVEITDIAHALSLQCRFAGHCTRFYSVAQHSVIASMIVPECDRLWALLHDAAEAYLVDLPRLVKRYSGMGDLYRTIEERLKIVICARFGLDSSEPASVRAADDILLMTEKRDLMPNSPAKWRETAEPLKVHICPWTPSHAERMFLKRFRKLTSGCLDVPVEMAAGKEGE
jgi:uncharacterized protein